MAPASPARQLQLQLLRRAFRLAAPTETSPLTRRPLHASAAALKKRKIAAASNSPPATGPPAAAPNAQDPLDLSSVEAALAPHDAHYRSALRTILHGGRFNPSVLGALPVAVPVAARSGSGSGSASGEPSTVFPLRELAQVVPRGGRSISLLVNDRAYVKPIMSAVQSSREFNQQPQRSGDNDLELLLKVEPERREELARRVRETAHAWRDKVRQARTRHDKVLKAWRRDGTVLVDVVRRAERELQRLQDAKMAEIDRDEAAAIRGLDRN
ncbi:Ribosome recycling factor domain protein [Metarhizium album ARSEF 1941]|uniref:Ribosome recycling factor domain protein n=1 Tax=Metarhizium album (strain ARSEF 1941) TaxID=1081103 RepID=A0A0B2WTG6_METAS|nr:Ribosome recycling factor domain protein [Metarhizium album ARSEF 1941]KHN96742.1 Ribosome recycling factor domain protein [Metarhizium album ARSEF 1941]